MRPIGRRYQGCIIVDLENDKEIPKMNDLLRTTEPVPCRADYHFATDMEIKEVDKHYIVTIGCTTRICHSAVEVHDAILKAFYLHIQPQLLRLDEEHAVQKVPPPK
jgi:hypothetical protein